MALPPAFSIASCAVFENLCAWMVTGPATGPLLSTLIRPPFLRSKPSSTILSSVNSVPGAVARISATRSRPRTVYSTRKILLKPRFGRRRCSGIWPPSNPRISEDPEREPWPLWPRVEVLPMPEPIPRPTRFLFSFAFLGARRLERLRIAILCCLAITPARGRLAWVAACSLPKMLFDDAHEMGHLGHHAADRRRVFALDNLVETGKAKPLDDQLVLDRRTDLRAMVLQFDLGGCSFVGHDYISSTVLPRSASTSAWLRSWMSASNVSLTTLCGFAKPSDLVSSIGTSTEVFSVPTDLPAITPVPSGAGFSITEPAPKRPSTWCGMVVWVRLILNRFFLAASMPLRIACGTSLALPEP